jgi:hypothetical protein
MAVAVEVTFHEQDALDNYKKSLTLLGATPGGPHPDPGCLFHWATVIGGGGVAVTDVWKTKEAFETFATDKLGPVMEEVGIAKPEIKFIEVDSVLTAGR